MNFSSKKIFFVCVSTNKMSNLFWMSIKALSFLIPGYLVSSLQMEHNFLKRPEFEGAYVPSWKILFQSNSSNLLGAIGVCSTLPLGVALLYHKRRGTFRCLDERILPTTLVTSTDRDWLYYEKPPDGE